MANILTSNSPHKLTSIISLLALLLFLPLLLLAVYQSAKLISRAAGKSAVITVDAGTALEPIQTDWYHAYSQGGEEAKDMLAPVLSQVQSLHPKRIRIDHIYDSYNVVSKNGNDLTFDFTRLDAAVETILKSGAKPLLVLSFMPNVIARDGIIINPPNNWDEWALVVQKTIEHYSGRANKNISDMFYEVWNEPDLDQFGRWKLSGEKNYMTLYHYASVGARNSQNVIRFYLGGPSTTGLYKNWIMRLVTSGDRIDFFSWHTYSDNPKKFSDDQRDITNWLLPYPNFILTPRLITEFGFTGNKSNLYGSSYASAFTASVIRQLISGGPDFLFSFQIKDGPGQAGNGWGLIAHEENGNKLKPRYYVYNFLDMMAGSRLQLTGEGTWVSGFASKNDQTTRILLVNFDHSGSHVETVPVTITNLSNGTYTYRERVLLGRDTTTNESIADGTLVKKIFMPGQSVILLELTKLR